MKPESVSHQTRNGAFLHFLLVALLSFLVSACSSIGPKSINRDQLDYGQSIGQNWKNQLLANLVRLRYVDMPVYLDVGQIVAGYSLETQVSGGLGYGTAFDSSNTASLGAGGKFTDRPTITYTPKTGTDYLTSMLKPIKPSSLLALIQSGYDSNLLFTWAVEAINGLRNYSVTAGDKREPDPEFYEFVEKLRKLQVNGGVAFQQSTDPASKNEVIVFFRDISASEQVKEQGRQARNLIGLNPQREKFRVVYSPFSFEDDILAIQTRSILQIMVPWLVLSMFLISRSPRHSRVIRFRLERSCLSLCIQDQTNPRVASLQPCTTVTGTGLTRLIYAPSRYLRLCFTSQRLLIPVVRKVTRY